MIREARITTGTTFADAVDAVCETGTEDREEATSKVLLALRIRGLCFTHAAA